MTSSIDWNPDWPGQIGLQHRTPNYIHYLCNNIATPVSFTFEASHTTDVDNLSLFASNVVAARLGSTFANMTRPVIVEVFEEGDEATFGHQFTEFRASSVSGTYMWNENLTPATANRLQTRNDGLYIAAQYNNSGLAMHFGDGLASFPLDRTILQVTPIVRTNATFRLERRDPGSSNPLWTTTVPAYNPKGVADFVMRNGEVKVESGGSPAWSIWTPTQIRQFAGPTQTRCWIIRCMAGGGGSWKLDYATLRVYWTMNPRVGLGIGTVLSGNLQDLNIPLTGPQGTGTLNLVSGQRYTVLVRPMSDYNEKSGEISINIRGMNSPVGDHPEWESSTLTRYANTAVAIRGAKLPGLICAEFSEAGSSVQMVQPYKLARGVFVGTGPDSVAFSATQTITLTGAATTETYGQVLASIGWRTTDNRKPPPSTRVRCEVLNALGVRVLGPAETTVEAIDRLAVDANGLADDIPVVYRRMRFLFNPGAQLGAGTFKIVISSPDTVPANAYLYVLGMTSNSTYTLPDRTMSANDVGNGAIDSATGYMPSSPNLNLTSGGLTADIAAVLATVPEKIRGVVASHGVLTTHNAKICPSCGNNGSGAKCEEGCGEGVLPFSHIEWEEPSSILIDHFEVERQDDLALSWEQVARVDGGTFGWSDCEARIGVQSRYRVRAVDTAALPGEWSDTASVMVGPYGGDKGMALCFSSNAAVGMSVVYPETWDGNVERDFTFLDSSSVSFADVYGRDRQVAFFPAESKGVRFSRTLLLNAVCSVSIPSMDIFSPLRNLSRAPIPYVCVRDGEGNRWYANIQVPSGTNKRPGEMWYANVTITEVSAQAVVHDTTVPQVETI